MEKAPDASEGEENGSGMGKQRERTSFAGMMSGRQTIWETEHIR